MLVKPPSSCRVVAAAGVAVVVVLFLLLRRCLLLTGAITEHNLGRTNLSPYSTRHITRNLVNIPPRRGTFTRLPRLLPRRRRVVRQ